MDRCRVDIIHCLFLQCLVHSEFLVCGLAPFPLYSIPRLLFHPRVPLSFVSLIPLSTCLLNILVALIILFPPVYVVSLVEGATIAAVGVRMMTGDK